MILLEAININTVISIGSAATSIIGSFFYMKYKIASLETRVDNVETKDIASLSTLLTKSIQEQTKALNELASKVNTLSDKLLVLDTKFSMHKNQ